MFRARKRIIKRLLKDGHITPEEAMCLLKSKVTYKINEINCSSGGKLFFDQTEYTKNEWMK